MSDALRVNSSVPGDAPPVRTRPATIMATVPVRLHVEADGSISADIPALPGCVSGGATEAEALANLREAAEDWLLARQDVELHGWPAS